LRVVNQRAGFRANDSDLIMMMRSLTMLACCASSLARATTTVCVTDVAGFQTALSAAEGSTSATFIEVARGTYDLSGTALTFTSSVAGQGQLDITGGYSADCSTIIKNPALTIIDAHALSPALNLQSAAGISVRYLTIQHGTTGTLTRPGLSVDSTDGSVIVDYNIIRNNTGGTEAGLLAEISDSAATAAIHVDGNLIVGNVASGNEAAGLIANNGTGSTYVTNNTVANNTSNVSPNPVGGLAVYGNSVPGSAHVSNNILWGNSGTDLYLYLGPVLVDNDYGTKSGSGGSGSSGDLNLDPQFAAAGDYHLAATSSLLGAGTLTPVGNLPTIDIEGHPRSYNGFVDMGAYERGDVVFANSFDD
jgi:hypothetical protein